MRRPSACSWRMASRDDGLIGSATPINAASLPSMARNMTVCADARRTSARLLAAETSIPSSLIIRALPRTTRRPPTRPRTPRPGSAEKSSTAGIVAPRSRAPPMMAAASGCSLPCSSAAANPSASRSEVSSNTSTLVSLGLPSVKVPVLSMTSVSTFSRRSSASAFFTRTPAVAPRPVPTMIAIGVARPSAHGQAMIRTATAVTSA